MPENSAADGTGAQQLRLLRSDPVAQALVAAIHAGDLGSLTELLHEHPGLADARLVNDKGGSSTPQHAAADWPGFFPHGPEVVAVADLRARGMRRRVEELLAARGTARTT